MSAALADRPVSEAVCLEAGAGVGNATAGLLEAGAGRVYAVTNDSADARAVRRRVPGDRTAVLEADVRSLPLATDSVEVVTAHALFNMVSPRALDAVATELTRVAAAGCQLVVDDYEPLPAGAAVRDLFALENAASELAAGRPAQTFYPSRTIRRLFAGYGWAFDRRLTLLDPVPWTAAHVDAHADAAREAAASLPAALRDPLVSAIDRTADRVGSASVGQLYSLAMVFRPRGNVHRELPGPDDRQGVDSG